MVVGVDEHRDVAPDELLAGIAVHLAEGLVGGHNLALQRVDHHAVASCLENDAMLHLEAAVGGDVLQCDDLRQALAPVA